MHRIVNREYSISSLEFDLRETQTHVTFRTLMAVPCYLDGWLCQLSHIWPQPGPRSRIPFRDARSLKGMGGFFLCSGVFPLILTLGQWTGAGQVAFSCFSARLCEHDNPPRTLTGTQARAPPFLTPGNLLLREMGKQIPAIQLSTHPTPFS